MRVSGRPGGSIYLADGRIVSVETPGAPSIEVILLHSQLVDEFGWDTAFAASAASGGRTMGEELVARGIIGAGRLEALLRTTIADGMLALAYGLVEACRAETPAAGPLTLEPGVPAGWLLNETSRRIQALGSLPDRGGRERVRVVAVPGAIAPGLVLGGGRDEIVALADGRRTPRDLAFALGRGLYATMLQLGQMRQEGLILTVSGPAVPPGRNRGQGRPPASADEAGKAAGLPRRKGRGDRAGEPGGRDLMPAALRLLRPRYGEGTKSGRTE